MGGAYILGKIWEVLGLHAVIVKSLMERMDLVEFQSKDGRVLQRTELTPEQTNLLKKLNISPPPRLLRIDIKGRLCSNTSKFCH